MTSACVVAIPWGETRMVLTTALVRAARQDQRDDALEDVELSLSLLHSVLRYECGDRVRIQYLPKMCP